MEIISGSEEIKPVGIEFLFDVLLVHNFNEYVKLLSVT